MTEKMELNFKECVESGELERYIKQFKKRFDEICEEHESVNQLSVNELFYEFFGEMVL